MFKPLISFTLVIICLLPALSKAEYERPISWSGNIYKLINKHMNLHRKFFKKVCRPGDEPKYLSLLRNYRGQGYYLPKVDLDIDRKAIIKNLPYLRAKVNYIEKIQKQLSEQKAYPNFDLVYEPVDKIVNNLLKLKKQHHQALGEKRKKAILKQSKRELLRLKKQFNIFVEKLFFMQSYNFPNDFLKLRASYEEVKDKEGVEFKKKANEIFFYRKIVEDGTILKNRTYPDKFVRSTLDTLKLEIDKLDGFLTENVRYDLDWTSRKLRRIVVAGKKSNLERLKEWHDRSLENFRFYTEIVQENNKKKAKFLIQKENEATKKLQDFVYSKQAETYKFWSKQSEIHKALYVLETILINEVGVLDGPFGLERISVAKVVLNRYHDDFYNQLEDDQIFMNYLDKNIDHEEELWLNVLFKVAEFSFTFHYIPGVAKIFCPDMSSRGNAIRRKNLKIALKTIRSHTGDFKGMRYFSRISMFGKIDMSSVWKDYERLPERVGYESLRQRQLAYQYHSNQYQYLYNFNDDKGVDYTVVKINERTYSMRWIKGKPVFFDYRNPHLFKYFVKKDL